MAIKELFVSHYRSIRNVRFRLKATNVLTGPNGCGKSNLYNSLFLLSRAATGGLAQTIAEEGGMESVLWAGPRRKATRSEPVRMTIAIVTDHFSYELNCGLPAPSASSSFNHDPEVKEEYVWFGGARRPSNTMFERSRAGVWARDRDGKRTSYSGELLRTESVLSQLRDPHLYPELSVLRAEMASWRFYHQFRSDAQSPLRQPQIGVLTPALSHDGRDLAAALQTIDEIGEAETMRETIRNAFPGAELLLNSRGSRFEIALQMPDLLRPLTAPEFSDGMLRYLCLVASLLSPRPPSLLALNEPETSLHSDLLQPLAKLIAQSSHASQLWITTHSRVLADQVTVFSKVPPVELELVKGETKIVGQGLISPDSE
jgi:predicted ATPase